MKKSDWSMEFWVSSDKSKSEILPGREIDEISLQILREFVKKIEGYLPEDLPKPVISSLWSGASLTLSRGSRALDITCYSNEPNIAVVNVMCDDGSKPEFEFHEFCIDKKSQVKHILELIKWVSEEVK